RRHVTAHEALLPEPPRQARRPEERHGPRRVAARGQRVAAEAHGQTGGEGGGVSPPPPRRQGPCSEGRGEDLRAPLLLGRLHPRRRRRLTTPPDWQLPPGVDRGLWDYLHDPGIARGYDAGLAGSSLFTLDLAFVERHCQPPGRLLDLGCGTGRLLVHAARKGYSAVGVDLSAEMLGVASVKAREAGVSVDLVQASIVE